MDFKKFSQLILIEQTLFGLPFAYLGVLFAGGASVLTWLWVTVAFAAARTAGMSFNRVIDASIDARNPRTRNRLVPLGAISTRTVWLIAASSSLLLIGASVLLNPICFYLSFPAVLMLFTYSYFKRFSASSHFYLGFVEAAAPIGGYLAVTGQFSLSVVALGLVIMLWIAGLDIVYSLQDQEFDSRAGLHSLPVAAGKAAALRISSLCYILALAALVVAGIFGNMRTPFWLSAAAVGIVFLYQQIMARTEPISESIRKFFQANLWISPLLLVGTAFSTLMR